MPVRNCSVHRIPRVEFCSVFVFRLQDANSIPDFGFVWFSYTKFTQILLTISMIRATTYAFYLSTYAFLILTVRCSHSAGTIKLRHGFQPLTISIPFFNSFTKIALLLHSFSCGIVRTLERERFQKKESNVFNLRGRMIHDDNISVETCIFL